jgi:MoaA/NifB/PqqE/SkfB family radical SAM enzyme
MDGGIGRSPEGGAQANLRGRPHDTLVLIYCMACPLKCDHCCHAVEDFGPVKIKPETAIDWIRQAAEIDTCELVVFTGGEPLLYPKDLLHILEQTRDTGLGFRIVTAAHWAETMDKARETLRPLVERGLTELSVSSDPSHQEYVPASYAENAARAAVEFGLQTEIAGAFWCPDEEVADTVDVPLGALTQRFHVVPAGRAKRKTEITPDRYRLEGDDRFRGCATGLNYYDITVYPDGEAYPCCSGGLNIEAELSFGNLHKEALSTVLGRMHDDRYTRLILNVGLAPIWQLAALRFPEIHAELPPLEPFMSICQVCAMVHSDPVLLGRLKPVLRYAETVFATLDDLEALAPAPAGSHSATTVRS